MIQLFLVCPLMTLELVATMPGLTHLMTGALSINVRKKTLKKNIKKNEEMVFCP